MYSGIDGLGIALGLILFLYSIFITVVVFATAYIKPGSSKRQKTNFYIVSIPVAVFLTGFVINKNPFSGNIVYCILLTILYFYLRYKRKKNYIP